MSTISLGTPACPSRSVRDKEEKVTEKRREGKEILKTTEIDNQK